MQPKKIYFYGSLLTAALTVLMALEEGVAHAPVAVIGVGLVSLGFSVSVGLMSRAR